MYTPYGGYYPQNNMRSPMPQVQPVMPAQQQTEPFKVVPVASVEEANAMPTDFMGTTLVLPDFAHKVIYTKAFNPNTGLPIFLAFRLDESQANAQPVPIPLEYDAKSEIEKLSAELKEIKTKLSEYGFTSEAEDKK